MSITVALAGPPNCGKSTLFNALVGFRAATGNFPGTSVLSTAGDAVVGTRRVRFIDLPGTRSFAAQDPAERVARKFLLSREADVVVAVMDASLLARSLELTLQLLAMEVRLVVALNLSDEAERRGHRVAAEALARRLGVPVVATVATRGEGVAHLARSAVEAAARPPPSGSPRYADDVEATVAEIAARLPERLAAELGAPPRFVALRLLERDPEIEEVVRSADPSVAERARALLRDLAARRDLPEESVMPAERHRLAMSLAREVTEAVPARRTWGDRVDDVVLHRVWGLLVAAAAFAALFAVAFLVGDAIAGLFARPFDALGEALRPLAAASLPGALLKGLVDGVAAGVGIVLPYLLPLVLFMSLLEDVGYLPRAAFLMDGALQRLGLHGKSLVPLILGYGCNVPALMATRTLESRADRVVTALLVPLVACSARTVVILALVAATLGPLWALGFYVLNLAVAALVGKGLSAIVKRKSLGILMDIPPYRVPPLRAIGKKVWFRIYEFVVAAWPVLLVASLVLSALEHAGVAAWLNEALRPLTEGVLGLPAVVGVTLFFGLLRKELSLVMLYQALGTENVASAMSPAQIAVFTLFVTFYVPCVATITALVREVGWRGALASIVLNTAVAFAVAGAARMIAI